MRYVLEGSVRKAANTVRVTAQLVDGTTGSHVWAERYDRELDDIFAIQDEISAAIVEALKAKLGLETPPLVRESQVVSPEAYDLYLRGLQAFGEGTVASLVSARSYFEEAIALEPTYAAAWYRLARTLWDIRVLQFQEVGEVPYEVVGKPAREAIRLDSTIGGAHTILGLLEQGRDWDLSLELRATGYELAPGDPFVVLQYGRALEAHGRIVEGEQLFREAIRLDPLHPRFRGMLGLFLGLRGRPADGLREIERAIELNPGAAVNWTYKGMVLRLVGDLVGSTEAFLRIALDLDPDLNRNWSGLAGNYLALGDLERAKTWIDRLREVDYPTLAVLEAQYLRANGQRHEAVQLALREFEKRGRRYRNPPLMRIVVYDLIARGALDEAEEFLLHYDDGLADFLAAPVRSFTGFEPRWFSVPFARVLQDVYQRAGRIPESDALTDRLAFSSMEGRLSTVQFGWRGVHYVTEAEWHMRGGRPGDALAALERAVELGFRRVDWPLRIRDNSVFEDISREPRFRALIETIELDMAGQREILTERRVVLVEELAVRGSGTAPGR
ncbi:MAG: tetratricopeptide repeat protein [Gemmatimonadetes bacterium]|nr:tetratricopeptide repeat protein [Gemmatimonadota bacterium]